MILYTPHYLKTMRMLLMATTAFDYFASLDNIFLQPRLVSGTSEDVPVYCYGFCKHWDFRVCFALYMLWQTLSLAVGASMIYTLFYKWYRLKVNAALTGMRLFLSLLLFYGHCLISLVCATVIVIRNTYYETSTDYASYGVNYNRKYLDIGHMTLGRIPNRINFVMMALGIYIYPIFGVLLSWHTNKLLDTGISHHSPNLRKSARSAVKGIRIQLIAQFLCYVPLFSIYFYSNLTKTEILFQQFFLALSPNLAAAIDPIINLYYVPPYREKVLQLLGKKKATVSPLGNQSVGVY